MFLPPDPLASTDPLVSLVALTADGWRLALSREGRPTPGRPPLLLVHGFLCNRFIWGLPGGPGLAGELAARGWDVWRLDLRGTASSRPPEGLAHPWDFSLDDHIHLDLPAALDAVRAVTGASGVLVGGHSMGGLIALAAAQIPDLAARMTGLLLVAPALRLGDRFRQGPRQSFILHEIGRLAPFMPPRRRYPADRFTAWAWRHPRGPAARILLWRGRNAFWGPGQVDLDLARRIFTEAVGATSTNLPYQFGRFARTLDTTSYRGRGPSRASTFHRAHGPWSYWAHLPAVGVPVHMACGDLDRLVPPSHLQEALAQMGPMGRGLRILPGMGHVDPLLGRDLGTLTLPWALAALEDLLPPAEPTSGASPGPG